MRYLRYVILALGFLFSTELSNAQVPKSTILPQIAQSSANGLAGGTILNNIVNSYVDYITCTGTGGMLYWNVGIPLCLTAGSNGSTLTMVSGLPQWVSLGTVNPRGTVKIQRVLPLPSTYGTATWAAYDAFNNIICSGTSNTTALDNCVIAALNTAFPYALNTPNSGYDFELIGGDEPGSGSPGSHHYGGGGAVLSSNTGPFHFPPIQNGNIRIGAVSLVTGGNADALVFDACEMCDINFLGAQTVAGGTGLGLRIKPTLGTPVDNGVAFSPSRAIFTTIGGPTRLDLSGNATANIDYANIEIIENNLGAATVTCGFLIDSPATGQNMGANTIKVGQLHGLGTAVTTMFCNGTQAPGGGAILGQSKFDIGIALDTAGGTNGFDEWGSNDEIHLHVTGLSTGYTLKFESGACNNVAYIWSSQASPTITDSSGCTGASANIVFVNGSMTVGGAVTRRALSSATTFFVNPSLGNDANSCLSSGAAACATLQGAWNKVANNYDCAGNNVLIQGVNTTYSAGILTDSQPVGCWGPQSITVDLAGGTVSVSVGNAFDFGSVQAATGTFSGCTQLTLQNMTMTVTGGIGSDLAMYGGCTQVLLGTGLTFNSSTAAQITVAHEAFLYGKSYTISGSAAGHMNVYAGAYAAIEQSGVVTCTGSPAFSQPFVSASLSGTISFASTTFSGCGSVTGARYTAVTSGSIVTGSSGSPTFFPGNSSGSSGSMGNYDGITTYIPFGNSISGTINLQTVAGALGSVTASLPANTGTIAELNLAQTWTALQTFNSGNFAVGGTATFTNSLSADITLNNTGTYFDGPSINIGTGLWCASGTVTAFDTAGAATLKAKLWDGTNIVASAITVSSSASNPVNMALSGCFNNPVGGVIKISVNDSTATTGLIKFNSSGNSHDSTISAWRVF